MLKSVKDGILIQINDIDSNIEQLKQTLAKDFFDKQTDFILSFEDRIYFPKFWEIINEYGHNLCVLKYIKEESVKKQTNIIKKRIRSGQSLTFEGDVLLLEDLNHGGELIATGNIYVMGKAMGFIHAGSAGDKNATVVALNLKVSHLKIAEVLAKNDDESRNNYPERAFLDEKGNLVVEEVVLHSNHSQELDQEKIEEIKPKTSVLKKIFGLKKKDKKIKIL